MQRTPPPANPNPPAAATGAAGWGRGEGAAVASDCVGGRGLEAAGEDCITRRWALGEVCLG
jgi:hypothetical protein